MILKIHKDEDPVLHKRSAEIKQITADIVQLAEDMKETMYQAPGVGLAAPQVGKNLRLIVIDHSQEKIYFLVFINPKIISQKGPLIDGLEGCLSVSKWEGFVERYKTITLSYQNLAGEKKKETFEDFPARVIQHEIDHLNGLLFTAKVKDGRLYTKEQIAKMLEENKL